MSMNKGILIIGLFVVVLFISGCNEYPLGSPKLVISSMGELEDTVEEIEEASELRITGPGPYICTHGITCQKPNGVRYSIPCEKDPGGNGCIQRPCDVGDWWISGNCKYVPINIENQAAYPH